MLENGYVMLHRSMLKWGWYSDIPTRSFFIHLIMSANWEDAEWRGICVKRGQRLCSISSLAQECYLSEQQIKTAIKHLCLTGEITTETVRVGRSKCTLFTVTGYDKYQTATNAFAHDLTDDQPMINSSATDDQPHINKYNKNNNNNNAKKVASCANPPDQQKVCFSENVFLTRAQHDLLVRDHGEEDTQELIELLDRYKAETGKIYNSDYHAIKKWVTNKLSEERKKRAEEDHSSYFNFNLDDFTEKPD